MKIYASRTRIAGPKYKIIIPNNEDGKYNDLLDHVYSTLAPYNNELNILCKSIKFGHITELNVKSGTYDNYGLLLHPNTSTPGLRLVELTRQKDFSKAVKVLVAKLVAELPDYIEEVLPDVQKSQARSKTVTARAMLCKLLAKQFPGIQINKDYTGSSWDPIAIDNWSDYTDTEIRQFAENVDRKYPTLNINKKTWGFRRIFFERGSNNENRRISYSPEARFIYDKITKTYIPYEE